MTLRNSARRLGNWPLALSLGIEAGCWHGHLGQSLDVNCVMGFWLAAFDWATGASPARKPCMHIFALHLELGYGMVLQDLVMSMNHEQINGWRQEVVGTTALLKSVGSGGHHRSFAFQCAS